MKSMPADHSNSCSPVDSTTGDLNDSAELHDDSTSDHSVETEVQVEESSNDKVIDTDFEDKAVGCFRFFVLFVLVSAMAASGAATWHFITEDQNEDFINQVCSREK